MNYNGFVADDGKCTDSVLPVFEDGGIGRLMFKRISSVNIGFAGAANAFKNIVSTTRNMQYLYPCDITELYDLSCMRKNPFARDGEAILLVSGLAPNAETAKNIAKKSVSGIYRLISRTNGFAADIFENEYQNIENARFYFCKSKNADSTAALMRSWGMYARVIGIAGGERVRISVDSQMRMDIFKSDLYDNTDNRVDITCEHMQYYLKSFKETMIYSSLNAVRSALRLDVGHADDLPSLVASLLGVYAACGTYGINSVRMGFHTGYTVAVRRDITLCNGMTVSLFDPADRSCGVITQQSFSHMDSVLRGLASGGEIIAAMPVRGSIRDTLAPVLSGGAVFVNETSVMDNIAEGALLAFGNSAMCGAKIGHIIKPQEQTQ